MKRSAFITLLFILSAGCSPNVFQAQSSTALTTDSSLSNPDEVANGETDSGGHLVPGGASGAAPNIDGLDLKGRVADNSGIFGFNGALAFDFDKTRGEFIIMVPFPNGMVFTPSGSFPNYPDLKFGPIFDATGRMKMGVRVPLKYIIKGTQVVAPAKLPSGEDLPAMPAGQNELPSFALKFPQSQNIQLNLYIGINAVAVYMSLPEKASVPFLPLNITLPLKNKDKTVTTGYLTYVVSKNGYPPGLFVSSLVPAKIARVLEDYFHL